MIPQFIIEEAEKSGAKFLHRNGALMSVTPAETMFGFTYHAHQIPPFKPEHTLILGYGAGTTAELMRKIWGEQIKITGVDVEPHDFSYKEYRMKIMDAKEYVWKETNSYILKPKFDYICIDLWDGKKPCDFIFDVEFAVRIKEMATKLVSMNVRAEDLMRCKPYHDYAFTFSRSVPVEDNQVLWWSVNA